MKNIDNDQSLTEESKEYLKLFCDKLYSHIHENTEKYFELTKGKKVDQPHTAQILKNTLIKMAMDLPSKYR